MRKRFLPYGLAAALLAAVCAAYFSRTAKTLLKPPSGPVTYLHSPLGDAILHRDAPGVEALLRKGAAPNVRYTRGPSRFIDHKAPPASSGLTPLLVAALSGNPSVYWDFYDYNGMEPPRDPWHGPRAFRRQHGLADDPAIVRSLLAHGADPNRADDQGWTPLLCASVDGNVNIARCLLDGGADVNKTIRGGETVLMDAAKRNNPPLVELLLQRGAHVSAQDDTGWSVLDAACTADAGDSLALSSHRRGSPAVVQLLVEHGVDVRQYPAALMTAVLSLNAQVVGVLLRHGGRTEGTDGGGLTALMAVPRAGAAPKEQKAGEAIASLLLAHGADVRARSRDGNTALTWAADKGDFGVAHLLLAHGADVGAANRAGHTALWFAANNGDGPLRILLLSHGANARNAPGAALPAWRAGVGNDNLSPLR